MLRVAQASSLRPGCNGGTGWKPVLHENENAFARGVRLFNAQRFWDAHEAWETIWLIDRSPRRLFLQGLIQLAAAFHHVQRGNERGAERLFDAALRKLERYPDGYCGVDRRDAEAAARERSPHYPVLHLLSTENVIAPPTDDW